MRRFGSIRALLVSFSTVLAVVSSASAVLAGTMNAIRIDQTPAGGALIAVSFAGGAPQYHVVGAGTAETSVLFDQTQLGPQVPPALAGAGPVTSITIAQTASSAALALHLASPTPVRVRASGATLYIDVSPPPGAAPVPLGLNAAAATSATGLGPETEVVLLKYADVSEIAGVLVAGSTITSNDTFTPQQTSIGTSSLGGGIGGVSGFSQPVQNQTFGPQGFGGQATGVAQRVNDNIAIDRRLNAVILSGTHDVIEGLKVIIDKLDIPVPSVMLEVEIVELTDSDAKNIGLNVVDSNGILINGSSSPNGYTIKSQAFGSGQATLLGNLYASITSGKSKIIAKPRILAQSGQPASILTGDAIPIESTVVVSGGSAVTSQQVNYVNVGVNLQIQPRVSSDGYVTSHIYSDVSSVTQLVGTAQAPQISQRTASTTATVKDGDSFVIGGLLQDNEIRSLNKLPFVGDLPLIGAFFRQISTSRSQDNLYVIVTPHIVGNAGGIPLDKLLSSPAAQAPSPGPSFAPMAPASPAPASSAPPPGASAAPPNPFGTPPAH
jgi:general secretion pathway protein D